MVALKAHAKIHLDGKEQNMNSENESKSQSANGTDTGANSANGPQRLSDSDDKLETVDAKQASGSNGSGPTSSSEALKAEAEKFKNDYLYLRAEFDNFKRQTIKERSDLRKYGAERLVIDLLNILDIFETALATDITPEGIATFRKGIEMTAAELRTVLNRHGVEEVGASGKPFDPSVHEALSSEETNEFPAGTVTRVFKKPYRLFDRVIRPGQVMVAKPKS